ncbi:hypothetical protein D3C77_603750 [compost metagenome]
MSRLIAFSTAELLEIEQALEPAVSDSPEFQAAIDSAFFKVGLALERPWALQQEQASIKTVADRLKTKLNDVRHRIDSMSLDQWVGWVDELDAEERDEFSRKYHSKTALYHLFRLRPDSGRDK